MNGCRAVSRLGGSASESLSCIPHVHVAVYSIWVFSSLLMSVQHFVWAQYKRTHIDQSKKIYINNKNICTSELKISLEALFSSFNISDQCRVKGLYLLHPLLSEHCDLWPLTSLSRLFATSAISGPHEIKVKYFIILFEFSSCTLFPTGHIEQQNRQKPEPTTEKTAPNLF